MAFAHHHPHDLVARGLDLEGAVIHIGRQPRQREIQIAPLQRLHQRLRGRHFHRDIDAGRTPEQVLADVQSFVAALRARLPGVRVGYLAIKPSLLRLEQLDRQQKANALVREWAATQAGVDFIDVATPMLDAVGRPRAELFLDDRLHLNADGYALWRGIISPRIVRTP